LAVISLGKMGLSHVSIANALDDFEVVAVCDNSNLVTDVLSVSTLSYKYVEVRARRALLRSAARRTPPARDVVVATS
jgi:hypothetical protein